MWRQVRAHFVALGKTTRITPPVIGIVSRPASAFPVSKGPSSRSIPGIFDRLSRAFLTLSEYGDKSNGFQQHNMTSSDVTARTNFCEFVYVLVQSTART